MVMQSWLFGRGLHGPSGKTNLVSLDWCSVPLWPDRDFQLGSVQFGGHWIQNGGLCQDRKQPNSGEGITVVR